MKALLTALMHAFINIGDNGAPTSAGDACPPALACVALAVYTESNGQPLRGQAAVAAVIHKRVMDSMSSPCDIVTQPYQFEGITRYVIGSNPWKKDPVEWAKAMLVSEAVFKHGMVIEECAGAKYFWTPAGRPDWSDPKNDVCVIGGHIFAK